VCETPKNEAGKQEEPHGDPEYGDGKKPKKKVLHATAALTEVSPCGEAGRWPPPR
jgi:hypothetical protein